MNNDSAIYRMVDHETLDAWLADRDPRGMGASESAPMCNASDYETQTDLWERKVGLRPKKPTTPAMARGHQLEASVRDRFMDKYGDHFDLVYHPYGMYYRTDYPMLYATLDGLLIAKHNGTLTIAGETISFKQGDGFILEIKNPAPRDMAGYRKWDSIPREYIYQASQQMFCSGVHSHILVANITGEYQQTQPYDERVFITKDSDVEAVTKEILATAPAFWACVQKKERPATVVELTPAEIVSFESGIKKGTIWDNLDTAKDSVIAYTKRFEGLTFTEDQYREAKKVRAELNKRMDTIESMKKGIKKQWLEPYAEFEARCKELVAIIENVTTPIDKQIKAFEEEARNHRETLVKEEIERLVNAEYTDLKDVLEQSGGITIQPSWLNASQRMEKTRSEVKTVLDLIRLQLVALYHAKSEVTEDVWLTMWTAYCDGRDLSKAQTARERAEKAKEQRPRGITSPASVEKPRAKETASEDIPQTVYTKRVEFSHTDPNEFRELIAYLKAHGFSCREIKPEELKEKE